MILALLAATALDSATLCARDARSDMPLLGVHAVDTAGQVSTLSGACARIGTGTWTLRKIGYQPARVSVLRTDSLYAVRLRAVSDAPRMLAATRVRASRRQGDMGIARMTATVYADSARSMGIGTVSGLIGVMPFASARGARGDAGLSLRGARREGVVVTLDGMALNDPSTGTADISDVPLALLGAASVSLGADPLGAGPGASGGTVALQSTGRRALSANTGSFGAHSVEGAYQGEAGGGLLAVSASYRESTNDFVFANDAGASNGVGSARERRVNNDERRGALTVAASTDRTHVLLLLSANERGMVGPANVRTYDADRSETRRALFRAQAAVGDVSVSAGARMLALQYRDPARPPLDSDAHTLAGDLDASGSLRAFVWRVGAGADRITATGNLRQSRGRAFVVASRSLSIGATHLGVGGRLDAIGAFGALPSFSAAAQHEFAQSGGSVFTLGARVAQAMRVPTLYDLYFSSPQRLSVRALRPERIALDAELSGRGTMHTAMGNLDAQVALVARDVRDAIVWFPGNFGFSPQNVGAERLRGFEAQLSLRPRWAAVSAWITIYDANLSVGGLRIPTPYVASVAGGGRLAARAFGFTASTLVRSNGARPYTAGPRNPDFELPAVTVLDIALSRSVPIGSAVGLLAVSLDNATGVSWQQVRGFPLPGRSWAVALTLSPSQ